MDTETIDRIKSLLADCRAQAPAGVDEYTTEDLEWVCEQLGKRPTREEWAAAGLAYVGGRHVGWAVPDDLTWHVPPRCQGQIVDVAFASGEGYYYRRRHDRSDRSVRFARVDEVMVDPDSWDPINDIPDVRDDAWEDQ